MQQKKSLEKKPSFWYSTSLLSSLMNLNSFNTCLGAHQGDSFVKKESQLVYG